MVFGPDTPTGYNDTVTVRMDNPEGASSVVIAWDHQGHNNWWWAIDNIEVTGELQPLFAENFDSLELARLCRTASPVATAQTGPPPRLPVGSWLWAKITARQRVAMMSSSSTVGPSLTRFRGTPPPVRIVLNLPRAAEPSLWLTRMSMMTRPTPSSTQHLSPRRAAWPGSRPVH